ncbi:MAG TPA: DUF4384 domain-containing protein [Blastocatellia bacterium]|nr:DUF4384 domain-containing protein [Blastocatellia bacterium]
MKAIYRLTAVSALIAALMPLTSPAQKRPAARDDDIRTRALFVNKRADAMRIVILKVEGGTLAPVDPAREFKQGDQIKVAFESNFDGFIYIVNVTPGGRKMVLFPYSDQLNSLRSNQRYELPPGGDVIEFDAEKGIEVLQVIMSRQRIQYLEDAIKNAAGNLGESAASAAAELQAGLAGDKISRVTPETGSDAVRSRGIRFAAGRDKNPEGSVVAISDANGSSPKLGAGEAAVFEIRLKHN